MISEFKGKYRFLSNFYPCEVPLSHPDDPRDYPSVEHAYQAVKCNNQEFKDIILTVSAGEAKRLGKICKIRSDWEEVKYYIMARLVFLKFLFNRELRKQLLDTGDQKLVEGNKWHDNYWGCCNCQRCNIEGQNKLGEILMKVRDKLRNHNEG